MMRSTSIQAYNPGRRNYWSDIEVTSTQYNLNIAPMCFAVWEITAERVQIPLFESYSKIEIKTNS